MVAHIWFFIDYQISYYFTMKKNTINGSPFRSKYSAYHIIILILIVILFSISISVCANIPDGKERWEVVLRTESLEELLLFPEKVISDPDKFWETDDAYNTVFHWHQSTGIPLDYKDYYNKWLDFLNERQEISPELRINDTSFILLQKVIQRDSIFQRRGIDLLEDFSPKNKLRFNTNVHITGYTLPYAFMSNSQIVLDILSPHFESDPDKIFNSITHECFHISYGYNRYFRTESPLENNFIYNTMLDGLQNEGIATYLGYLANDFFPAYDIEDYLMFDDSLVVFDKIEDINKLFGMAANMDADSLRNLAWDIGVLKRGYYIAGAHMAKTIDEQLGRLELIQTIQSGPLSFINTYNGLAEEEYRIYSFDKIARSDLFEDLKKAAIQNNKVDFENSAAKLLSQHNNINDSQRAEIERFGYGFLITEEYDWAIEVFKFDTILFNSHPNPYDCLAEAYYRKGDNKMAIELYKRALEIDPDFKNAQEMIRKIQNEEQGDQQSKP